MSSGGMDWAYRMIANHQLDALEVAVVLHLGWRDHPDFRTDRGIARALNRDRTTVRKATRRLEARGIIQRRSHQWVSCETVKIVEQAPDAPKPKEPDERGGGQRPPGARGPRGSQAPGGGGLRPPQKGVSGPHKEKREIEKTRSGPNFCELGRYAQGCVAAGNPVVLPGGRSVRPDSEQWKAWRREHDERRVSA